MESVAMKRCELLALLLFAVSSEGVAQAQTADPAPSASIWNRYFARRPSVGNSSGYLSGQGAGKAARQTNRRRQTPPPAAECKP